MKGLPTAIVLAGGLGTRLRSVVNDLPKCMALVNDKPFLEYVLHYLENQKIQRVILSVGYKKESIVDFFGTKWNNLKIDYCIEDEPLGTGGAIRKAAQMIAEPSFYVLNGDTLFDVDLKDLERILTTKNASAVLALRRIDNISRYGSIECNSKGGINAFIEKGEKQGEGLINGGIYFLDKAALQGLDLPEKFSIEKDFFQKYLKEQNFYGIESSAYFIDIGIPDDYKRAQLELKD